MSVRSLHHQYAACIPAGRQITLWHAAPTPPLSLQFFVDPYLIAIFMSDTQDSVQLLQSASSECRLFPSIGCKIQ